MENVTMTTKIKNNCNKIYIMKRTAKNYYRKTMITQTKETQILKNYADHMLN